MERLRIINDKMEETHKYLIKAIHKANREELENVSEELNQIKILLKNLLD